MVLPWLNVQRRPEDIELQAQQQNARRAGETVVVTAQITLIKALRRTKGDQVPALSREHVVPHHGVLEPEERYRTAPPSGEKSSRL